MLFIAMACDLCDAVSRWWRSAWFITCPV